MRLLSVTATFGVLDQASVSLRPAALHLVVDSNERGKSTLVAAIVAALYGFPGRHDRERWVPRSTSRFEVGLEVEAAGRNLSIRRNFHHGSCVVRDLTTQREVTEEFQTGKSQWNVGRTLLGLNREQFLRSAMVRQGEITALGLDKESGLLTARIQQLVDTVEGDHTAAEAIGVLDGALRSYEGVTLKATGMVRNEIKRLQTRIIEVEEAQYQLQRRRSGLDAQAERMASARAEAARLRAERGRLLEHANVADAREAAERLRFDDERRRRAEALEHRYDELTPIGDLDHATVDRLVQLDGIITSLERSSTDRRAALETSHARLEQLESEQPADHRLLAATTSDIEEVVRLHEVLRRAGDEQSATASALDLAAERSPADSADLARRFASASPTDVDELSRFYERRHALVEQSGSMREAGVARISSRPVPVATPYLAVAAALLLVCIAAGFARWWVVTIVGIAVAAMLVALSRLKATHAIHGSRDDALESVADAALMEIAELDRRTISVAVGLGYDNVEMAVDGLRAWQRLEHRDDVVSAAGRAYAVAEARSGAAAEAAVAVLFRWNRAITPDLVAPEHLDQLHGALVAAVRNASETRQARQEVDEAERQRIAAEQEREARLTAFSNQSSFPAGTERERLAAMESLREQLELLDERRAIEDRRREIAGTLLDDVQRARLVSIAAHGEAANPGDTGELDTAEHNRAGADALLDRVEAAEDEAHRLELAIGAEMDDFERTYPALDAELSELRRALARAEGFEEAVALARDGLDAVAHESHRDWAAKLNASASAALTRFGSPHAELRFGEDLDFVLIDRTTREEWSRSDVERSLSAGARDQVYLAVRMALSSYFSTASDPLPLIFDDPFATSDDERFAAAMDYLADEATRRQVIVLTCHEQRHRWWLDQTSIRADRVQWANMAEMGSYADTLTPSYL